jgi:hypothetical protein
MVTRSTIAKLAGPLLAGSVFPILLWAGLYYYVGVWPPDIGSDRVALLASAESSDGHRFKIVQFWGDDFYTTRVEHTEPDGTVRTAVIDSDDRKQWRCAVDVVEREKKLVIHLSDGSPPLEYSWETHWFILPPGQYRARA